MSREIHLTLNREHCVLFSRNRIGFCFRAISLLLLFSSLITITLADPADEKTTDDLKAANQRYLSGNYGEAKEAFKKLKDKHPHAAQLGIARIQLEQGKTEDVLKGLTEYLKTTQAKSKQDQEQLADLAAMLAEIQFDFGKDQEADAALKKAFDWEPDNLHAKWIAAQRLKHTGKLKEATEAFRWFVLHYNQLEKITDPNDLHYIGLAAAEYARWTDNSDQFRFLVNDLKAEQLELEPKYWRAYLDAGNLFIEKFNEPQATMLYQKGLTINPNAAELHAALGQLALDNYRWGPAATRAKRALAINPNLLEGHILKIDLSIANFKMKEAADKSNRFIQKYPYNEDLLGRLAGCYIALDGWSDKENSRFAELEKQTIQRNPTPGNFYFACGKTLDRRRRWNDAVHIYRRAIETMPKLLGPRGQLGMLLMRLGEEEEAKKLLEISFERDPFNVRVKNTLEVLDVLDTYETYHTDHFTFRFNKETDRIFAKYAGEYLESHYEELCQHFDFRVPDRSLIEIFSKAKNTSGHSWFSARMVGLPFLGTVGACAGKMVAIATPNEQSYNWSRVLKHEFIHVINLQQTDFNLPHWLAEGIAVYHEPFARPRSWNDLLLQRYDAGTLFTLDNVNLGFIRPTSQLDWQMAYCQAEIYVEYIIERFGEDGIAKLLARFSENLDTTEAIEKAFNISQEEFEAGFDKHMEKLVKGLKASIKLTAEDFDPDDLFAKLEENPDDPKLHGMRASMELSRAAPDMAVVRKHAMAALKQSPGDGTASYSLARVYLSIGDIEKCMEVLQKSLKLAKEKKIRPNTRVLALAGGLMLKQEKFAEAEKLYDEGRKLEPESDKWLKRLAQLYIKTKQPKKLEEILVLLTKQDPDDLILRMKLCELSVAREDWPEVIERSYEALYVNVMQPKPHKWLALAYRKEKKFTKAIEEFEILAELDSNDIESRLHWAETCLEAEDRKQAKVVLADLLKERPQYKAAKELLEKINRE